MIERIAPFAIYSNIFLVMLGLGVIAPMLSDIQGEFDVSYGAIAWTVSAFAIARLITDLPAGLLSERLPRLRILLTGSLFVALGSLAGAMAPDLLTFMLARALSGVGSAVCTTVGLTIVLDTAPPERRGRASGLYHSAVGGGAFFGPGFGALLASAGDWRWALGGAGAAALLSSLLLLLVARSGALTVGAPEEEPGRPTGSSARSPVAALGILRAASVAYVAAFAIFYARGAAQQTVIPLAGRDAVGLSIVELSAILMAGAALGTVLGPFVGALSDRIGRQRLLAPGPLLMGSSVLLATATPLAWVFVIAVGVQAFAGAAFSLPSSMIIDRVASHQRGFAIGLYRLVGDGAMALGPVVAGLAMDRGGFRLGGASVAAVVALALITMLVASRPRRRLPGRRAPARPSRTGQTAAGAEADRA